MSANRPQIETFGCRINIWESEVMRDKAHQAGLNNTVIINTCAVTAEAEKQARQSIRRIRREQPDAQIVVTGCAAQIHPDSWDAMPEVDFVIGNQDKMEQASWDKLAAGQMNASQVSDMSELRDVASHMLHEFSDHTRAFLQVQQGCDHRCTFCIIPYGRGPSRSAGIGSVVEQVRALVSGGAKEVVLSGVDITSWGADLPGTPKLGQLVRQILKHVPELPRLRLSSIDPAELDSELMAVLGSDDRLMPHLHLSVQHGDDLILKRMKRRHLARDVKRFCAEARRVRPDVVFGADIIAGFPTEDEAAHHNNLQLIKDAGLTHLHVFGYSAREGTPAALMPQLDKKIIKRRTSEIRSVGASQLSAHLDSLVGQKRMLLVERGQKGHLPGFEIAHLKQESSPIEAPVSGASSMSASQIIAPPIIAPGEIITVQLSGHNGRELTAEIGEAAIK